MREIKFRAFDKILGNMVYPNKLYHNITLGFTIEDCYDPEGGSVYKPMGDSIILMQFTGLRDKNWVEIYEGDICKFCVTDAAPSFGSDIIIRTVEWWNGQFVFNGNRHEDDYINFGWWVRSNKNIPELKQIEVIGNIYEHADLLSA